MTLTSYLSTARIMRGAPAAADVEQCHAGLQAELAQRQVDLGELSLFERHVVALEVGAAVGLRRVQKQPEEVVRQVVMRLHVLEMRSQIGHPGACYACGAGNLLSGYLASVNWWTSM